MRNLTPMPVGKLEPDGVIHKQSPYCRAVIPWSSELHLRWRGWMNKTRYNCARRHLQTLLRHWSKPWNWIPIAQRLRNSSAPCNALKTKFLPEFFAVTKSEFDRSTSRHDAGLSWLRRPSSV